MTYKFLMRDLATLLVASIFFSMPVSAVPITFDWDGQFTVQDDGGYIWTNIDGSIQTVVEGTFTFDPVNPDLSEMSVSVVPFSFATNGDPDTTLTNIYMEELDYNLLYGGFGVDWCGDPAAFEPGGNCFSMYMGVVWDVTGLREAIDFTPGGLQVGDVISGDMVLRDDIIIQGINSATPAVNGAELSYNSGDYLYVGPTPMATTSHDYYPEAIFGPGAYIDNGDDGIGGMILENKPGPYASLSLDIGGGNSMTVIETVPVPAAVWLFSTGLIGLVGVARLKKSKL